MSSTGLPGSGVVCLYAIAEFAYVIEKLRQIFAATPGYEIHYNPNATVDDLKKLPRCAVLVFASHSGRFGPDLFGLKTASSSADHPESGDIAHWDSSAWITSDFIAAHWRFESDSFVFLHGCKTFHDEDTRALRATMGAVCGAAVYGGWSMSCTGHAADDVLWRLFDQLLGANVMPTNDSSLHPQRPFSLEPVKKYLRDARHNPVRYEDEDTWSEMRTEPCGDGDFGLLAPSIHHLEIDEEARTLTLHGMFDQRPLRTKVFVKGLQSGDLAGAYELTVDAATDSEIVCTDLPRSSTGAAGYVVVAIDLGADKLLQSNPVPITAWSGTFTYTIMKPAESSDSVIGKITAQVTIRGDVHKIRAAPGAPVTLRPTGCMTIRDMERCPSFEAKGRYSGGEPRYSYEWSGCGPLLPGFTEDGAGFVSVAIAYDAPQPKLLVLMQTGEHEAVVTVRDEQGALLLDHVSAPINVFYLAAAAHGYTMDLTDFLRSSVTWDPRYDIPASEPLCKPIDYPLVPCPGFTAELKWDAMTAMYPPSDETPA